MTRWETVIGLEVHAQLKTQSKLFSSAATQFNREANTQTSFIDAGLPGVLPVLNQHAVHLAVQFGLAIQGTIQDLSFFERKNYFYPDLPKGYQISQHRRPLILKGQLSIKYADTTKMVKIAHAHLEEDAGKSIHDAHAFYTGIDLNRAGIPLLEIVTEPCLSSAEEAIAYLKTLQQLLRFLDICDGNMQEGSFRCDVNLSLRPHGSNTLGTRTELKNLNSFRFIEKAIRFEETRHQAMLEAGQRLIQETRLYCPETDSTEVMRKKEDENDYRYFPDPDLLPIQITPQLLQELSKNLPVTPAAIQERLQAQDHLNTEEIEFLLTSPGLVRFYDTVKTHTQASSSLILNWLRGTYSALLHEQRLTFDNPPVSAQQLGVLLDRLHEQRISAKAAKHIFYQLLKTNRDVDTVITDEGYDVIQDDAALDELIRNIVTNFPQQAAEYRAGKEKLLAFFVGQIMKQTKGQAAPELVHDLLQKYLSNSSR